MKKIFLFSVMVLFVLQSMGDFRKPMMRKIVQGRKIVDLDQSAAKLPYTGFDGGAFDKSANGAGWYQAYNRKVQWNRKLEDGSDMEMIGAVYRRLSTSTGSGTIGGMTGVWEDSYSSYVETIYDHSPYWNENPGGRYPYTAEFINGYIFGQWTDLDAYGSGVAENADPVFTVGDATWGYDWVTWADPLRVEAVEGGASVPGSWSAVGDVVYDADTGYYYWTQSWSTGLELSTDSKESVVVGRTMTPEDPTSWIWTDYNDIHFDATDDSYGMTDMPEIHIAYCKDKYGNGTGYGLAVAVASDVTDSIDYNGTTILQNSKISYMYTTNWGADDGTGDWTPNWQYDEGNKMFQIESKDLFDWYGETLTSVDSIGVDGDGNIIWDTLEVITMNDPLIMSNISAVATENNVVHLLIKVHPASLDNPGYFYFYTDNGFRPGYYHVSGQITDTGVNWGKANFIANMVDLETGEIEFRYSNFNMLSLGYAGHGQIYASWLDKPTSRAVLSPYGETNGGEGYNDYYDDAFLTFSYDDGRTWEIDAVEEIESGDPENPIWNLYYAKNITNTGNLHEEGWCVSTHGNVLDKKIELYAAHQYYDPNNPIVEPPADFVDFEQFLHVWKITGDITGIETETVSMVKDFELYQNYPNPFNPATEINFRLKNDADVKLSVFNTKGEMVTELTQGKLAKGLHTVSFDANSYNSGVYFYQLDVNGRSETKKMVLTK